jgi:hypothetical protein
MVCILLSSALITTLQPEQSSVLVASSTGVALINPSFAWKQKETCLNQETWY